jgi:hypothetical protein
MTTNSDVVVDEAEAEAGADGGTVRPCEKAGAVNGAGRRFRFLVFEVHNSGETWAERTKCECTHRRMLVTRSHDDAIG